VTCSATAPRRISRKNAFSAGWNDTPSTSRPIQMRLELAIASITPLPATSIW
jgi:hypothetical protein